MMTEAKDTHIRDYFVEKDLFWS